MTRHIALVFVALSLVSATGCKKVKEKVAENAAENVASRTTGTDVDFSSGGATVRDPKTGSVVQAGAGAQLPDGWPKDVPAYPGGTIMTSVKTPQGLTVSVTTPDSADKVKAFYKGKLPGTVEGEVDMGGMKTISTKDGNREIVVAITSGGSTTNVMLSVSNTQ